ncbi:hypothetical protein JG688_00004798 [Phytophthora aleatoria]|uniref:Uncharacterized protein n=1 Tax=Phytophthora aleatoria TaxID=2496075 RepID=A0A8J5J1K6_9STRA|nr:hypothetical protein JG688_00004798 [Phytophthora aleatoria]
MLQFISPSEDAAKIERFRARHRRLLRTQQQQQSPAKVEALDEDDEGAKSLRTGDANSSKLRTKATASGASPLAQATD